MDRVALRAPEDWVATLPAREAEGDSVAPISSAAEVVGLIMLVKGEGLAWLVPLVLVGMVGKLVTLPVVARAARAERQEQVVKPMMVRLEAVPVRVVRLVPSGGGAAPGIQTTVVRLPTTLRCQWRT